METTAQMKQGDFTKLAKMYSSYRPGYASSILQAILGIVNKPASQIDFADVGAGTGIWTRMVAQQDCRSVTAVEPNVEMRKMGMAHDLNRDIHWQIGSGEQTGLADASIDLLSMASSFHWVDFVSGTREFHRVLKSGGHFVALWNPRYIDDNPILVEIEKKVYELAPHIKRVSSGKSAFVDNLSIQLSHSPYFEDLVYLEGRHTVNLTPEQYMGVWNSVNDIRAQMGEAIFEQFMNFVKMKIESLTSVSSTYLTRAWIVRKK